MHGLEIRWIGANAYFMGKECWGRRSGEVLQGAREGGPAVVAVVSNFCEGDQVFGTHVGVVGGVHAEAKGRDPKGVHSVAAGESFRSLFHHGRVSLGAMAVSLR